MITKRFTFWVGSSLYIILIALSIIFYKERTIMFDTAFQLFQILRNNGFAIQVNRFGSGITQAFPLIASQFNLSLQWVTIVYSVGYNVFYFLAFLITLLVFKNVTLAWVNLLFTVCITTHTFFWIQCELVQGVIFTLIYLAWLDECLQQSKFTKWFYFVSPFFIVTIIFFHPLLPFVFLFGLAFLFLNYRTYQKYFIVLAVSFVVLYLIKSIFIKTAYDTGAMAGLDNFKWLFPNYFTIQANKNFITYCAHHYYFIPVLLVLIIGFYIHQKSFLKLLLFCGFFFGYLLIVNVCHQGGGDQFYLESQYLMLVIFLGFPLLYDVLPAIKFRFFSSAFLVIIILIGVLRIYFTHHFYTDRLTWYEKIVQQSEHQINKKNIYQQHNLPMNKIILSWGSAYEFWLLSTIENKKSSSIIITETENEFDYLLNSKTVFIGKWEQINYSDFKNKAYFNFTDSSAYIKH